MVWKKLGSRNFSSCPNGSIQWIWDVFGECAQDGWDEASVGLGLISILCFAASTFPQFIKAYKTGNMDQALSLWFLLGWIGGDSCNLIGSFLADQLPLQVGTVSSSLSDKETEAQRAEMTWSGSPSWDVAEGCWSVVPDPGTAPTPGTPASLTDLHGGVLCLGRPGDADAVLLLQVQETPLSVVCPHQLCAVAPHGDGVRRTAAECHWARGCPEGNLPRADTPVPGARQQALHSAGNHWLRHRFGLQRVVPALPAASDPNELPPEVHPGDLLLTLRAGDAGEHAVRAERAAQKPGGGPERGQLPAAPPALACGQPGCTAARHHHLHPVPGVQAQHPCLRARAPPPPQLTRAKLSTGEQGPSEATPGRERCGQ
ncbi:lysosomal amino acid transporter 1 homolog isoform X1 [Callithrix jacchus]